MSQETDLEKQLEDMRKITMLTGQLSSVHEKTLKTWPMILYDCVGEIQIKYDLTKEYTQEVGEGYIKYYVDLEKVPEGIKEKSKHLVLWSRNVFWNDIKIEVYINNELVLSDSSKEK